MVEVTPQPHVALTGPGDWLQVAAAACWLPQAAAIAIGIQRLADGGGAAGMLGPALAFAGLAVARAGLDAAGARLVFRAARGGLATQRGAAIAAVARQDPFDRGRPAAGESASIIAEQAELLLPAGTRYAPARLRMRVVPALILLVVLPLSWAVALVLAFAAPLIPLFMAVIGWRAKAASEAHLGELGRLQGFLLDRLRGLSTIRALGAIERTGARLDAVSADLRRRVMAVLRIAFLSSAVLELFSALGVAMVAVYVGFHLLGDLGFGAWGDRLALGEAVFMLLLAPAFFEPLRDLAAAWHDRAAGAAARDALAGLVAASSQARDGKAEAGPAGAADRSVGAPAVELQAIGFGWPRSERPALDIPFLRIGPSERVAIMGPSGCGKSTMLALIAGLAIADRGQISVGGVRLGPSTADAVRSRIGWLSARPWLRATGLRDNVALGRSLPAGSIDATLDAVGLGPMRMRRSAANSGSPGRVLLSESGDGLSGGEWVRIALARATVDPERDLVLADEPTAHLDTATADAVTAALIAATRGRTLIVATHDPVLASRMDRVVHLLGGMVVADPSFRRRAV